MLVGTDFERSVSARLLDFFAAETLWQRRLWDVGACSSLRELVEATAAVADGALTQESVNWFKASLSETLGPDVGIGSPEQRRVLQGALKSDLVAGSHEVSIVRQIADSAENTYLSSWASALGSNKVTAFRTERVARAVSAHMLSRGFSPQYLHRWWTFHLKHEPGTRGLGDLVDDAHNRSTQPLQSFEVIAPLRAASGRVREIPEWLSAKTTSEILSPHTRRPMSGLAGALRFSVEARDTDAAVDIAADRVDRYVARITLGGRNEHLEPMKHAWVSQSGHDFSRTHLRPRRGLEIPVLYRREEPITASVDPQIDASLELLGPVDLGSPSAAVSGAWAAVETLLTGPGDRGKVQAADRLASLIVCSFVRAELTELAHSYLAKGSDASFVDEIGKAETNTRRAGLMADLLHSSPVTFPDPSEQAAADRMHRILANPHSGLADVENHVKRVIRRLYRVRNLVLHNAATNSTTLTAALRTAVPLLGTGIDRIVRGAVLQECRPLELAARARIVLDTASNLRPAEFADLLGLAD
ncbi:MAG: hypothetical protein KTV68_13505 [Acidimicrobiia bacterium]|nr:hypothetical protein [Acidimicrobiia bacterium]MCY4434123.1 hypothetical protein [bacterium]